MMDLNAMLMPAVLAVLVALFHLMQPLYLMLNCMACTNYGSNAKANKRPPSGGLCFMS